jgi:hypothetical protein
MSCELMFELESAAPRMWPTPPSFVAQVEGSSAANVTIEYRIFILLLIWNNEKEKREGSLFYVCVIR